MRNFHTRKEKQVGSRGKRWREQEKVADDKNGYVKAVVKVDDDSKSLDH